MSDITLVKNDRLPTTYVQFYDKATDEQFDISPSTTVGTVKFRSRGNTDESIFEATLTKVVANLGIASFAWPADSLDQTPGRYELEFTLTQDSLPETALDIISVRIKDEFPDAS